MDHDIVRNIILYLLINIKEEFNMPNWCDNYIKIKGKREEIIKCIEGMKGYKALYKEDRENKEDLEKCYTFNATLEVPEEVLELGYAKSGYYWQKDNWGCKWDMLYESKYELDNILKELKSSIKEENEVKESESYNYLEERSYDKNHVKEVEFFVLSPWSPVDEWIRALSEKHRDLEFSLSFEISEEFLKGSATFKEGEYI